MYSQQRNSIVEEKDRRYAQNGEDDFPRITLSYGSKANLGFKVSEKWNAAIGASELQNLPRQEPSRPFHIIESE
jgi:hypothetical protein